MYLKITAIIPTFNRIQFLNRSIESIINQTYPVNQIILVDNLSTDNTKKYINFKYKQIKVLNQKNRGVSHSRNLGIENSSNDWIAFLDSDDAWMPNKI